MTMDSHAASTVDVSAFRKAMGSFPTGVTVVTVASGDGFIHGLTVNSFSSVSLGPMLVLVCPNETSRAVDLIERAGAFGVNVFSAGQQDVSRWFANQYASSANLASASQQIAVAQRVLPGKGAAGQERPCQAIVEPFDQHSVAVDTTNRRAAQLSSRA
jgi:flavin reductase (DIM6/NTAB) family NADH-FMN oxidoreductase RutF